MQISVQKPSNLNALTAPMTLFFHFFYKPIGALFQLLLFIDKQTSSYVFFSCQLQRSNHVEQIFDYVAPHATNMLLVHMFFYVVYFETFIGSATYVLPIFFVLVCCSSISSIVINRINGLVLKTLQLV